ncbi:MAG TPA: tetratricopeptide repeat protein [Bryobacteraceae bacterium]|jgi:tetratricopeptide (TPR) repeat protein|nr:tetratricopeptide repeat protein [Bryobacteraceae bacterium]
MTRDPKTKSVTGTFLLISVAIVGFAFVDRFLARTERVEGEREAERLYQEGEQFEKSGDAKHAIDRFRAALAIADREEYGIALASALLQAGRPQDAESVVNELLQRDSVNAEADLMMARVLVKEGNIPAAASYYHRAIYDQWRTEAPRRRLQVRLELIDLLALYGKKQELLSELLAVQSEANGNLTLLKRIAPLYLKAGSPGHASEAFRDILRSEPHNAEAYSGLGEAEFAEGRYRQAEGNFAAAVRITPQDEQAKTRLELCRRVTQLDPTRRGLSRTDRYRRSVEVLTAAADDLRECSGAAATEDIQQLIGLAQKQISQRVSTSKEDDAIEANLNLSEQLWSTRLRTCRQTRTPAEQPLALVLAKISQ